MGVQTIVDHPKGRLGVEVSSFVLPTAFLADWVGSVSLITGSSARASLGAGRPPSSSRDYPSAANSHCLE